MTFFIKTFIYLNDSRPGELAEIKITPELHGISEIATWRFDYEERKCVAEDDKITLNNADFNIKQYSQINCFVAAAAAETSINCMRNDTKCLLEYMKQIGRWNFDHGSEKKCLPSCTRSSVLFTFLT